MKKLNQFKTRKHFLTVVCLLIGMLVLTTSVYANYDNANGYTSYKAALKHLALETNNVTLDASVAFEIDGKEIMMEQVAQKITPNGKSTYSKSVEAPDYLYEVYTYEDGKYCIRYFPEENAYYQWEDNYVSSSMENLIGVDMDDKTTNKLARFMELGVDMLIGDLKNNVVLLSNDDGVREYSIDVATNQMPEIVNAGISLLFSSVNYDYSERNFTTYDDWMVTFGNFWTEKMGTEFPEDLYNGNLSDDELADVLAEYGYADYDEFWEECSEVEQEFWEKYDNIFYEEKGGKGVIVILEDGSYDYYESYYEYLDANEEFSEANLYRMFGDEPVVQGAKMIVKINDNGELLYNYAEATLIGYDDEGNAHTATVKINLSASDYGTTVPDTFDATGKEKWD